MGYTSLLFNFRFLPLAPIIGTPCICKFTTFFDTRHRVKGLYCQPKSFNDSVSPVNTDFSFVYASSCVML